MHCFGAHDILRAEILRIVLTKLISFVNKKPPYFSYSKILWQQLKSDQIKISPAFFSDELNWKDFGILERVANLSGQVL